MVVQAEAETGLEELAQGSAPWGPWLVLKVLESRQKGPWMGVLVLLKEGVF